LNSNPFISKKETTKLYDCKNCEKFYPETDFFEIEYLKIIQEADNNINSLERDEEWGKYHQQKLIICPKVINYL
jgi:hypothetical protein